MQRGQLQRLLCQAGAATAGTISAAPSAVRFHLGHYNKDKNKTFFFFSEEARRIINYATFNPTWPTQGMLQGNFIQPVCITQVTSCRHRLPGGRRVGDQHSHQSVQPQLGRLHQGHLQQACRCSAEHTLADTTARSFPEQTLLNFREELVRIDQRFNEKFSVWGKFSNDAIPTTEPGGIFSCNLLSQAAAPPTPIRRAAQVSVHAVNLIRPNLDQRRRLQL